MNKNIPPENYQSGFTLVEILVSLVIILILVIAFVPLFDLVAKTISSNKAKETATALANTALEEMRSLPFIVLDPTTGEVVTDPTVKQLGIQGGNPPGSVPAREEKNINGITYTIKTDISWDPSISYKNISVVVESPGVFSGSVTTTSKFYTLATEEGEMTLPNSGFILAQVKDNEGNPLTSQDILIRIEAQTGDTLTQENFTFDGEKLFGLLRAGSYTVSAQLPSNMAYSYDQMKSGDWITISDIEVNDGNTSEVTFYIDQPAKINLSLIDDTIDESIVGNGIIEINWNNGSTNQNLPPINFKPSDFVSEKLPAAMIGNLWPGGTYSFKLTNVLDGNTLHAFKEYNMATAGTVPPKKSDNSNWDGTFDAANTTLNLSIKFYSPPNEDNNSVLKTHLSTADNMVDTNNITDPDNPSAYIEVVSHWQDLSGNDYGAELLSGQPILLNSFINGFPVIKFTRSKKQVLRISIPEDSRPSDDFTVFIVAKPLEDHPIDTLGEQYGGVSVPIESHTNESAQRYLMYPEHKGDDNVGYGFSLGKNGVSGYEHGSNYMPPVAIYTEDLSDFNLLGIRYQDKYPHHILNGSLIDNTWNPNAEPTRSWHPREHIYAPRDIGGGDYGYFEGYVAEILIYDAPLNDANIALISSVLKEKYALP